MSTMVARGNSPSTSVQEKGSRNKRKFCADPPVFDPNLDANQVQSDWTTFDLSLLDQNPEMFSLGSNDHENNTSDECPVTPVYRPTKVGINQFHEGEWNDIAESELEESLLNNLHLMFRSAIKIIVSYGYSEEIATVAVSRTGHCFGAKDVIMSIVESALQLLASGNAIETLEKEKLLEELKGKETCALNEMINVVREFKPWFSRGEAMWRLLISDMSVFHAVSTGSTCPSAPQLEQEPKSSSSSIHTNSESHPSVSCKPNLILPNPKNSIGKSVPNVLEIPNLPNGRFTASIKDGPTSLDCVVGESSLYVSQLKQSSVKKVHSASVKREFLRQKTVRLEKSGRKPGSKAVIRASKHNSLNGMLYDHSSRTCSGPANALNMENTLMKLSKAVGGDVIPPQGDMSLNIPFKDMPIKTTNFAKTELSLSLPSSSKLESWIPKDKMDEMIQELSICEKDLEAEMKEWSDWAQQKVMEAARRLQQDKPELQILRQEKDEVARLKKEKQSLEENTRKQLSEMEIALSIAGAQVEKHNAEARIMEREKAELKKELAALKCQAAKSASSCREKLKNYLNLSNNANARSWEREKAQLQEELVTKKKKFNELMQQLGQAKEHYDHLEAKWKKEETIKQQLLDQHNALTKEREQLEVASRAKENTMRINAETGLQKHKEEIRKLEFQISQIRSKSESNKIAALKKWSNDPKPEENTNVISKLIQGHGEDEDGDVDRERECVMCLCEERSVVFLPCSHQVLCETCNGLHEQQGSKDCPSCRTIIEKRIIVCPA